MKQPSWDDFKQFVRDKKIAVVGIGISNEPLLRLLSDLHADLSAFDRMAANEPRAVQLKEAFAAEGIQINWYLGDDYLEHLHGFDLIFRTPVMMPSNPVLRREHGRGAVITSEMEVFMQFCPAPTIAVTGSDGKTTTTSLISRLLQKEGYRVFEGGNIGHPLLAELEQIAPDDWVVLELSSFQLISLAVSPNIAVLTNITPNHLDVHSSFEEYRQAKLNILAHQNLTGKVVLNAGMDDLAEILPAVKGEIVWFNGRPFGRQKAFVQEHDRLGFLAHGSQSFTPVLKRSDLSLKGAFNVQNFLAAMAAVDSLVSEETIAAVAREFAGVAHRLEFVREIDGVRFYNSSIDSSPNRSINTLSALIDEQQSAVLVMGGKDKKCDYSDLGKHICAVTDRVVLYGDNSQLIQEIIRSESHLVGRSQTEMKIVEAEDFEQAVRTAWRLAKPGELVLLTPAGTSFDHFRNFEVRGDTFKKIVNQL